MPNSGTILITGATGKVGMALIKRLLAEPKFDSFQLRALCHNRVLELHERMQIFHGSIVHREIVEAALDGVTHIYHLATCKEDPLQIMDVAIKGLFWTLETCRASSTFRQFIMLGGDAGVGHFIYPHAIPVTETQARTAYPGCYALSKVLEEVMLEQYYVQYDMNGCCLRAPWIMEKDDFKFQLSFGEDVFGGPRWRDLVGAERADEYVQSQSIPVMLDAEGQPVKRNFIHVDDLIDALLLVIDHPGARQQLFNISMDEPVDYREMSKYLTATRGLPSVEIRTAFHSTWLDNTKAKLILGWRPRYDMNKMIDSAWEYVRAEDDIRRIWYPG